MFHYQPCISYAPQQPLNQQEMLDTMEAIFETEEALKLARQIGVLVAHDGDEIPF